MAWNSGGGVFKVELDFLPMIVLSGWLVCCWK